MHRAQEKIHLLHESLERGQRHMQSLAKMLTMVIKDNDKIRRPASQQQQQQRAAHAETQRLDAVATKAMWHNPAVARFLMPLSSPSSSPSGPRLGASSSAAGLLDSGRPDHASRSRSRTRSTQFTMVDTADLDLAPHSESQEWIDPNSSSAPASHSGAGSVAFTRPTSVQWPRDPHLSQQHFIADASTNHAAFQRQLSTSSYLRPPSAVERERTMHAMPWKSPSHQFEHSPKTDSYTFSSSPASAAARTPNGQSPTSALPASKRKVVERYLVARAPPADEPIPAFCFVPASRAVVTPDQSVSAANSSPHGGHAFAHPEYQHADSVHRQQYQLPSPQHRLHSASRSAPISPSAHPHPKSPPAGYSSSSPSSLAPLIGSPVVMCFDPSLPVPVVPPLIEPALFRHNRVIKTVNVPLASLSPSSLGGTRPVSSKLSSDRAPRIGSHAASPHRAMPFTPVATSVPISPPHRPSHAMGAQSSASSAALSFVEFPSTPTSKARAAGDQPLAPYSLPLIDDSSRVTLAPEVVVEAPHHSFAAPTDALSSALAVPSAELATLAAQIVTIPSALVDIEAVESSSPSELAAPVATTDGDTTLACESVVAAPASLGTHSADLSMTEPVDAFLSEQSTAETTNTSVSTTINASSASNSTSQSHVANTSAPADMASPLGSSHAAPSFDAPAALMAHLTMQLPPWHNTAAAEFGSPLAHRTSTGFSLASASACV